MTCSLKYVCLDSQTYKKFWMTWQKLFIPGYSLVHSVPFEVTDVAPYQIGYGLLGFHTQKMKMSGQADVSLALQWIFPNCQEGEVWVS